MKMKMFAVLDAKIGVFGSPFCDHRDESAVRSFSDAVNDGSNAGNMWFKHPEDFALYQIGDYDSETGTVVPLGALKCLVTASALKKDVFGYQDMPLFKNGDVQKTPQVA